jgi:hypothetical protein
MIIIKIIKIIMPLTICTIPKYLYLFSSNNISLIDNLEYNIIRIGALNNNDINLG